MVGMVAIVPFGKDFTLRFSVEEASRLGLDASKEYSLSRARDGVWVLVEGKKLLENQEEAEGKSEKKETANKAGTFGKTGSIDAAEQKIIGMVKKLDLRELVEGVFEKSLNDAEKKKLSEMVSSGKVLKFKLNPSYKKPVYRLAEQPPIKFENREKPIEGFTLENDGFLVVKNELRAKSLSEELRDRIKAGEIKGTRSFSGEFFIIRSDLLDTAIEKVLKEIKAGSRALSQISSKTSLTPTLVRIAAEFLKEEGQLIEKKKEIYQYIE